VIGCIVQARMGSSRLPGKIMKKVDNDYLLIDYVINQLRFSKRIGKIIVATTNLLEDNIICEYLKFKKIEYFRGSSENVLDRYYQCAKQNSIDVIVRITADNPLIDPMIVDLIIEKYLNCKCDLATNTIVRTFPYGTEVEVFSFESLKKAWKYAKKPSELEHVTPFIRDPKNGFTLINIENDDGNISNIRYTVDKMEDLILVREIVKNISERPILLSNIIEIYKNNPIIYDINKDVKHDGYARSIKKDQEYLKSQKHKVT